MKYLMMILGFALATVAWADPQVNRDDDYCHIPLDKYDAGVEASVGPPDCSFQVIESGGEADGYCKCHFDVPEEAVQALDDIEWTKVILKGDKTKYVLKTNYKKLGTKCKLTAAGGDEYYSTDWMSKVVYKEPALTLEMLLVCFDGKAK